MTQCSLEILSSSEPDPLGTVFAPVLDEMKVEHPVKVISKFVSTASKSYALTDDKGWEDVKF